MKVNWWKSAVTATALSVATTMPMPSRVQAQRLGIVAGGTFSQLRGIDNINVQSRTGTMFGASLLLPLGGSVALQPELLFSNKGSKFNTGTGGEKDIRLDYLEIPVLLRYDLAGGAALDPHIYAGPSIGYKVGCNVKFSGGGIPNSSSDCTRDNFDAKTLDWGAIVGAGVDLSVGGLGVTGGARYGIGLADINKADSPTITQRVHNGTLTVYVGLLLGKR
jgi:hypothetical protein